MEADPLPSNAVDIDTGNGYECMKTKKKIRQSIPERNVFMAFSYFFENSQFLIREFHTQYSLQKLRSHR